MLDVSVLYGGLVKEDTPLRYGSGITEFDSSALGGASLGPGASRRCPAVVWNLTRTCNFNCVRCNTDSESKSYPGELTTAECRGVLDDLRDFGVEAVLCSGGEPMVRRDFFEIVSYARQLGLRVLLLTNGTLIDRQAAECMAQLELDYVGIGLESISREVHDRLRGVEGAFDRALDGLENLTRVGQHVGLRFPIAEHTCRNLPAFMEFLEAWNVKRVCFQHLCPIGRGRKAAHVPHIQVRQAVNRVFDLARMLAEQDKPVGVVTANNSCDGPYLYLRMLREGNCRAEQVRNMLEWHGGALYSDGVGIGHIDFLGTVHACPFSGHRSFGNVRRRNFSEIWKDALDPVLLGLKNRMDLLKGRCRDCRFRALCGGASRVRAEIVTGDPWAADPGCYLISDEIYDGSQVRHGEAGQYESEGNSVKN